MPKEDSSDQTNNIETVSRELARIAEYLSAVAESNSQIERLLQVLAQPIVLSTLPHVFRNSKQFRAYELSDGVRSTRQIADIIGVDQKTVSTWWRTWEQNFHIIEKTGIRGQFRKRYEVTDLIARHSRIDAVDGDQ